VTGNFLAGWRIALVARGIVAMALDPRPQTPEAHS
jgi:hypothetical protein